MSWRKGTVMRENSRKQCMGNGCSGSPHWAGDMRTFPNESKHDNIQVGKILHEKCLYFIFLLQSNHYSVYFVSFFSRRWFMIHLYISLSSACLSLLKIHNRKKEKEKKHNGSHVIKTVPLLLTCFEEFFVSEFVDLYQICNNTFIEWQYVTVPWFTDPVSCWYFSFQVFATSVSWYSCISTSDKFLVVEFLD